MKIWIFNIFRLLKHICNRITVQYCSAVNYKILYNVVLHNCFCHYFFISIIFCKFLNVPGLEPAATVSGVLVRGG
jgi:hypothetical protein